MALQLVPHSPTAAQHNLAAYISRIVCIHTGNSSPLGLDDSVFKKKEVPK